MISTQRVKVSAGKLYEVLIVVEVSRLAIVCPCLFRIMIICYSPRPKSG